LLSTTFFAGREIKSSSLCYILQSQISHNYMLLGLSHKIDHTCVFSASAQVFDFASINMQTSWYLWNFRWKFSLFTKMENASYQNIWCWRRKSVKAMRKWKIIARLVLSHFNCELRIIICKQYLNINSRHHSVQIFYKAIIYRGNLALVVWMFKLNFVGLRYFYKVKIWTKISLFTFQDTSKICFNFSLKFKTSEKIPSNFLPHDSLQINY
jgi:hypothetical protein